MFCLEGLAKRKKWKHYYWHIPKIKTIEQELKRCGETKTSHAPTIEWKLWESQRVLNDYVDILATVSSKSRLD